MTEHRTATEPVKPAGSDAVVGTAGDTKPGDNGALLDGTLDPTYQQMMIAGNKAAGADSGGSGARANHDLQEKGHLTKLSVTGHDVGAADHRDAAVTVNPRDLAQVAEKQRLAYVQATVQNFLPVIMASASGKPEATLQTTIAQKQSAIKAEAARGEFGPESQAAYGQYVDWLEKTALPSTFRDLQIFKLPPDEAGGKGAKAPALDLKIDRHAIPDDQALTRLDDAVKWAQAADARVQTAQDALLKKVDGEYAATVSRMHLPSGWLEDIEKDHSRWRRSVGPLIDGALTARTNIEILDELHKAGGPNLLDNVLPPTMDIKRDASGKIEGIHLDLPKSWDLNQPENKQRADNLAAMVAETTSLIAPTIPQLKTIASHPERAVNWGDTELHGMKGRFDGNNNFLGLCSKDDKPAAGEHTQDINLVESRFSIENKDNKIIIHQQVQAQSVPWWGYQNLIGVQNVGNKIDITHTYNPTDNIVVRTDSGYEVKQAQDLGSYRNWQMCKHYGEKTLMCALDAGMIVSGTIEASAAFKAARVAGVGMLGLDVLGRGAAKGLVATEGVDVTSRLVTLQAGKGIMRTTIGVTGLLNNAGARESSFGQYVNTARSVYFLADAGLGLGAGGFKAVKSVLGRGSEASLGAGKVTIAGLTDGSKAANFYHVTHGVFKVSEFGFMPLAAVDLTKGIQKVNNDQNAHVIRAAEIVASEERKP